MDGGTTWGQLPVGSRMRLPGGWGLADPGLKSETWGTLSRRMGNGLRPGPLTLPTSRLNFRFDYFKYPRCPRIFVCRT